jgi:adenylate cyclase
VGCLGATLPLPGGRQRLRREFTAIGETVNLAQRLEQLTKAHGGPILLSEHTRRRLRRTAPLAEVGPLCVPGCDTTVVVYRVERG